jgi:hypothetical protein
MDLIDSKTTGENRGPQGAHLTQTEEWAEPQPHTIPPPTYWPMVLAFGTTIASLSLVTTWFFLLVGVPLMVLALFHWVGELRR